MWTSLPKDWQDVHTRLVLFCCGAFLLQLLQYVPCFTTLLVCSCMLHCLSLQLVMYGLCFFTVPGFCLCALLPAAAAAVQVRAVLHHAGALLPAGAPHAARVAGCTHPLGPDLQPRTPQAR